MFLSWLKTIFSPSKAEASKASEPQSEPQVVVRDTEAVRFADSLSIGDWPSLQRDERGPVVYLIEELGQNCRYKIGRTDDFPRREQEILRGLPYGGRTRHLIRTDDSVWLEKLWHEQFARHRRRGEWFELDTMQIRLFCSFARVDKDIFSDQLTFPLSIQSAAAGVDARLHSQSQLHEFQHQPQEAVARDDWAAAIKDVIDHYDEWIKANPSRRQQLQASRVAQLGCMEFEVERLCRERGYSVDKAVEEWKRKAKMAADAKAK